MKKIKNFTLNVFSFEKNEFMDGSNSSTIEVMEESNFTKVNPKVEARCFKVATALESPFNNSFKSIGSIFSTLLQSGKSSEKNLFILPATPTFWIFLPF